MSGAQWVLLPQLIFMQAALDVLLELPQAHLPLPAALTV